MLGLPASTVDEGVESYAQFCRDLATRLGVEKSFQEQGVDEQRYMSSLDALAMRAYEDQCAPANPRLPMLQDMKDIMVAAYYGISQDEVKKAREKGVAYLDMNPNKGARPYHKDETHPGNVKEAPIPESADLPEAFTHKVDELSSEAEMIAAEHE
jgi:acetaldehyde dehydrogenase/alcohol dehydrogenase